MKKANKVVLAACALAASSGAMAQDWQLTVAPSIDFAFKTSQSELQFLGSPLAVPFTGSPSYTTFIPSLAASFGPIYGVVSYDSPLSPWHSVETFPSSSTFNDTTYYRKEATLSVGYRLPWSVAVFAGFVHGRSDQTTVVYDTVTPSTTPNNYSFDERGYYVGANYSHAFGNKGTLSAGVALGNMDGKLSMIDSTSVNNLLAKTSGYSFSLGWSGPLSGSMVYRTGLKYTNYDFNFDSSNGSPIPSGFITLKEEIYSFTIGIGNYF